MTSSRPVVFFGTEEFSLSALTGLIEANYKVVAVVTKPDSKRGRGQKLTPPTVKVLATSHSIPVYQPEKLAEIEGTLKEFENPVGVLSSYGKIIPESIINLFTPGIINIHPSLLPKYRGASPIESAILNGDDKTGVSIMELVAEMDAGPVYATRELPLMGKETRPELYHSLAQIGTNLLLEYLPAIIDGSLKPAPQDDTLASYCDRLSKSDSLLMSDKLTATEAERKVRAHLGFPKTKAFVSDIPVIITKARVSSSHNSPLDIRCADNQYLSIEELIAPSGRKLKAEDFIRGYIKDQE